MKNRGFGHLKTRLFTIKTSKNLGLGGPWYIYIYYISSQIYLSSKPRLCVSLKPRPHRIGTPRLWGVPWQLGGQENLKTHLLRREGQFFVGLKDHVNLKFPNDLLKVVGNSNSLLFSSLLGEMIQFDEHSFSDGLVQPPNSHGSEKIPEQWKETNFFTCTIFHWTMMEEG